jgi:hypothetical protein
VIDLDIVNQQWLGVDLVLWVGEHDGLQQTEGCLADRLRRQDSLVPIPAGTADVVVIGDDPDALVIVAVAVIAVAARLGDCGRRM